MRRSRVGRNPARRSRGRKFCWGYVIAPLAVLVLAAASLLITSVRERASGVLSAGGEKHIAVLPFDNIGNNPANEPLAEGLMDEPRGGAF